MTSNHRSKTILVLTVYVCVLLIAITATLSPLWAQTSAPSSLSRSVAPSLPLSRADIQAALDRDGYCWIPPGTHKLDGPIRLGSRMRLVGAGVVSSLRLADGAGDWAIVVAPKSGSLYDSSIDSLSLLGGGLLVHEITQTLRVEGLTIDGAPLDGVRISGIGERMILRDVVARSSVRHGLVVSTPAASNNGIVFDHCTAQWNGGAGVLLETTGPTSEQLFTVLRDCTVQDNCRGLAVGETGAEIEILGLVRGTRIENHWTENVSRDRLRIVGIRTRAATFVANAFPPRLVTMWPGRLVLAGGTSIQELAVALDWTECFDCRIEQLNMPASAAIYAATQPVGDKWLVPATAVRAAPSLPAASQPGGLTPVRRP